MNFLLTQRMERKLYCNQQLWCRWFQVHLCWKKGEKLSLVVFSYLFVMLDWLQHKPTGVALQGAAKQWQNRKSIKLQLDAGEQPRATLKQPLSWWPVSSQAQSAWSGYLKTLLVYRSLQIAFLHLLSVGTRTRAFNCGRKTASMAAPVEHDGRKQFLLSFFVDRRGTNGINAPVRTLFRSPAFVPSCIFLFLASLLQHRRLLRWNCQRCEMDKAL